MLASALSLVDPLLSSPEKTTRHNDGIAALQLLPPLELPASAFASLEGCTSLSTNCSVEIDANDEASIEHDSEQYSIKSDQDDEEDAETPLHQLMNRGNYLRQLRLLALADEEERKASSSQQQQGNSYQHYSTGVHCDVDEKKDEERITNSDSMEELQDQIILHPITNEKILDFNSYLAHQRYYDDLKHVDVRYMNYGTIINSNYSIHRLERENSNSNIIAGDNGDCGQLIIEQRKSLGKGGVCWDAAFCLGEFVIGMESEWNPNYFGNDVTGHGGKIVCGNDSINSNSSKRNATTVLELGAGTGLCGLMVAKATNCHVILTDLPELMDLMQCNVDRNFGDLDSSSIVTASSTNAKGTASAKILRWGTPEDYAGAPYDVIIGADIVASLYDPVALAQTLHDLSGPNTKIYMSSKSRLDKPHQEFEGEMNRLFGKVTKFGNFNGACSGDNDSARPCGSLSSVSRLRNPGVFFIVAEMKL